MNMIWTALVALMCPLGAPEEALEEKALACAGLRSIELKEAEARSLLETARRAAALKIEFETKARALGEEQQRAFTAFREEDLRNTGFSPEVERAAAEANHREQVLKKEFCDRMADLEEEAPLTEDQRARLEAVMGVSAPAPSAKSDPDRIHEELREIHEAKYGTIEPIGRFLLNPALVGTLGARLGEKVEPASARNDLDRSGLDALRDDINLLNLMNGMNYSGEQLKRLEECARKADESRKKAPPRAEADATAYRDLLSKIIRTFERGEEPAEEDVRKATRLRKRLRSGDGKVPAALIQEADGVLTDAQRQVLVDYSPCLIPPRNLKDPVRVGQSASAEPALGILRRVRHMSDARWKVQREGAVERALARIEEHGGAFSPEERPRKKEELGSLFDRVRLLDDVDFELQKDALAAEVGAFSRKDRLKEELKEAAGDDTLIARKIGAFLLHPRAAALYRTRLEQAMEVSGRNP